MKTMNDIISVIKNDEFLADGVVFCKIDPNCMAGYSPYVIIFNNGGIVYWTRKQRVTWCMPNCLIVSNYPVISVFYTRNASMVNNLLDGTFTEEDETHCVKLDSDNPHLDSKDKEELPESTLNAINKYGLV